MSNEERRRHLRYPDPGNGVLRFLILDGESEKALTGLPINESHRGLACVYVGPALEVGREIVWRETEAISTPCRVIRCEPLHAEVHLLALQIMD
ncbi:MAG: hypothetical protein ACM3ST_16730 [Bdellovibrio bacteriovorus]